MENREFIPAADLPVAEGEEVSVLCVENGEMKQKPASGLGAKPAEPDMVIEVTTELGGEALSADKTTVISGDYANVVAKLQVGDHVDVVVRESCNYGGRLSYNDVKARCCYYSSTLMVTFVAANVYAEDLHFYKISIKAGNVIGGVTGREVANA